MAHSLLDQRTGIRIIIRPCSGRRAEQRARRHVLRELDRRILQLERSKPQNP